MNMSCVAMIAITFSLFLGGCAVVATPVDVSSSLVHGADSSKPLNNAMVAFASSCISDVKPAFWARYFNHSEIPERIRKFPQRPGHRLGISATAEDRASFAALSIPLVPVFAQNMNHLGGPEGEAHGRINAADLASFVGVSTLVTHLQTKPLYFFLNQEPDDDVLTLEYFSGWVRGFSGEIDRLGGNKTMLRPAIYGRPQAQPKLLGVLDQLTSDSSSRYAGLWLVSIDTEVLNPGHPAKTCGRLKQWRTAMPEGIGTTPILLRQYVLDARNDKHLSVDLNAVNPEFQREFMDGLISVPME